MKKVVSFILVTFLGFSLFGCSEIENVDIIALTFPVYDWVSEIMVDVDTDLTYDVLIDTGVDTHSFTPTNSDVLKIINAKVIIIYSLESEAWVGELVKSKNTDVQIIELLDYMDELLIHGHLDTSDHDDYEFDDSYFDEDAHDSDNTEDNSEENTEDNSDEHDCDHTYDEHVWLSVKSSISLVQEIKDIIVELDKDNESLYETNTNSYIEKLKILEQSYSNFFTNATSQGLIFADRFPFIYLMNDYNMDYYAAFDGCSADTVASASTIAALVNYTIKLEVNYIYTIEGRTHSVPETILSEIAKKDSTYSVEILLLNSMQAVTRSEINEGFKYITIMEQNLELFKLGLC